MNEHDSEIMAGILEGQGHQAANDITEADLILVNTCCIREKAESKVLSFLGEMKRYKEKNANLIVGVCGCMAQQKDIVPTIKKAAPHVNLIFGTHNLSYLGHYVEQIWETGDPIYMITDEEEDVSGILNSARKYPFKALVNIVYGCNNFCTYCIVPYVRGRERSRKIEDIVDEITLLAKEGVVEVTLLGQNVNSYGNDLEGDVNFPMLLKEIEKIDGIELIRYMTSHPKDFSDELIETIANSKKITRHFHLPVQSGSNTVLDRMNRKYTREHYLTIVKKIKAKIPDAAITTDLIVGFPNETDEEFQDTLDLVQEVSFDNAFSFIYSKRKGTPAASFEDAVDLEIKKERLKRLNGLLSEHSNLNNKKLEGQMIRVLVEGVSDDEKSVLSGHTNTFKAVHFVGSPNLIGQFVNVRIIKAKSWSLDGELENNGGSEK